MRFGEVGAAVSLGANAVRAIAGSGIAGPDRQIADRTPDPWQDIWFEWRRGENSCYLGASVADGIGQSSVHRADFLDALASQLPEGIVQLDKRAVHVEQVAGQPPVFFTDGSEYNCS